MYTIVQTARLNGVNPEACLQDTLAKIHEGHPTSRSNDLMHGAGHKPGGQVMMVGRITIEPAGDDTGTCDCCGRSCRCVWGYAYADERCLAAYFVRWIMGQVPEHGANIDLILGEWGDAASPKSRSALALAYRLVDSGPSMMVIDADSRPFSSIPLVGRALRRDEVIGTNTAQDAFAIADAVLARDQRVAEILAGWQIHI